MRPLVTVALLVLGSLAARAAAPAPKAGPPRLLVVSANTAGNWDVFLVQPGTGETKNLTDHKAADTDPVWSPDGKQIAFVSDRDGAREIWVMAADGTGVRQLTQKSGGCTNLRWSPDGSRIAFVGPKAGKDDVYTADAQTGKITQLTTAATPSRQPAWAPDGKKLTYSDYSGRFSTVAMNADGSGKEKLTGDGGGLDAAWSPDGKRIAFTAIRGNEGWRLFTMDPDGKNMKQLATNPNTYGNVYPQWSPDGQTISYGELVGGVLQVATIGADGTGKKVLTSKGPCAYTRWSPDGKSLAYTRYEQGQPAVLVVSGADGQDAKDLIRGIGAPAEWKPK